MPEIRPRQRPTINVGPHVHLVADHAIAALATHGQDTFQRAGVLVEARGHDGEAPTIRVMTLPRITDQLSSAADFQRKDERGEWTPCKPPKDVAEIVKARGDYPGVRELVCVVTAPTLRPDGTVLDQRGYDSTTKTLYVPQRAYPPVPAAPTLEQARIAMDELKEAFVDFPFRSEPDRYVPIALIMTFAARNAIDGPVPAYMTSANQAGTGKGKEQKTAVILATGVAPSSSGWPGRPEEQEKVLGSHALLGLPYAYFENIDCVFGGAAIDRYLTAEGKVSPRKLGVSDVRTLPWRQIVAGDGNNIVYGRETVRRVLECKLVSKSDRPEERTDFSIADLKRWAFENHPRIVVAALTVLRAYVVAARPAQDIAAWGSFEAWRGLVASAIHWASGVDVMSCRVTIKGDLDPETSAAATVIKLWSAIAPNGATAVEMIRLLNVRGQAPDTERAREELRGALEMLVAPSELTSGSLGTCFRGLRNRRFPGGRYLDGYPNRNDVIVWTISGLEIQVAA